MKIEFLLLFWFSVAPNGARVKLHSIRHSLEFLGPRTEEASLAPMAEEDQVKSTGLSFSVCVWLEEACRSSL